MFGEKADRLEVNVARVDTRMTAFTPDIQLGKEFVERASSRLLRCRDRNGFV